MVFASTKLVIWKDLFVWGGSQEKAIAGRVFKYKGKHPERLITFIPKLLHTVFNPGPYNLKEVSFSKEVKKGRESFSFKWELNKELDRWSYYRIDVKLKGWTENGEGEAEVELAEAVLITEYPQDTYWQKTIFYEMLRMLWHRLFYEKKMEEYLKKGRLLCNCFVERLQQYFEKLSKS